MDDVRSVRDLHPDIGTIFYYPDPTLFSFREVQAPNGTLKIKVWLEYICVNDIIFLIMFLMNVIVQ